VSDATRLLKFRRLLETHMLGEAFFAKVGEVLQAQGLKVGTGTIVDAARQPPPAPKSCGRPGRTGSTATA
jgi:IS5 family transposase